MKKFLPAGRCLITFLFLYIFFSVKSQPVQNPDRAEMPNITLTFRVDMAHEDAAAEGVYLLGSITHWMPVAMENSVDKVWEVSLEVPIGYEVIWIFRNGTEGREPASGLEACGISDGEGGFFRSYITGANDVILEAVCFGSCTTCENLTATEEPSFISTYDIYPNPASQYVMLEVRPAEIPELIISIRNLTGQTLKEKTFIRPRQSQMEIDLAGFPDGLYLLSVSDGKYVTERLLVVKN